MRDKKRHLVVNDNLKKMRLLFDLPQCDFARILGIKRSLLGAYDEYRAEVKIDVVKRLIKVGYLHPTELYGFMFEKDFKPNASMILARIFKHRNRWVRKTA